MSDNTKHPKIHRTAKCCCTCGCWFPISLIDFSGNLGRCFYGNTDRWVYHAEQLPVTRRLNYCSGWRAIGTCKVSPWMKRLFRRADKTGSPIGKRKAATNSRP